MHLPALQSPQGMVSVLELDRAIDIAQLLGIDPLIKGGQEQLTHILSAIISQLATYPSAVIADPVYSFPLLTHDVEQGLILRIGQTTSQTLPQAVPQLASNWGINEIANNFAVATLELWYHPKEESALEKKKIVAELYNYCQYVGIDFLLKLNMYSPKGETEEKIVFQDNQLQAVQEFRASCDVIALQFPGSALAAATITAELDHPWLVTLVATDYEESKIQLRTALENDAQGFLVGNNLWHEISQMRQKDQTPDISQVIEFITTTARDRIIELVRITNEFGQK